MRIQHNIPAMSAYRNYNTNTSALAKNLEKLSSGYKINRAGDDAAGLAISEKMRAQITGLNAAQKNVKDGISLVKTAEGAMQEIQDMLNRMDYLATQSANGTYDNEVDRANLQKEVDALKTEINRIADSANFNGIKLLDGSQGSKSVSAVGELDESAMIDGIKPSAAGKATVVVNMGASNAAAAGGGVPVTASTDVTKTYDGTDLDDATAATYSFKIADSTGTATTLGDNGTGNTQVSITTSGGAGTQTSIADLATATDSDGNLLKDIYDISVTLAADGSEKTGWTDTTLLSAGDTVTLTAKAKGANAGMQTSLDSLVANADGTNAFVDGADVALGAGATNQEASYEFKLNVNNLQGGQKFTLNGQTITVSALEKPATGADTSTVYIGGAVTAQEKADAFKDAVEATFKDKGNTNAYDCEVGTVDASGVVTVKITAAANAATDGNSGSIRVETGSTTNPVVGSIAHTKYQAVTPGGGNKFAQVTYEAESLKATNLKAGMKLTAGGATIKIVDSSATTVAADEIKESDVATKLAETLENQLGFAPGLVTYNSGNGTLTFTAAQSGSGKLNDLKTDTAVSVTAAPTAGEKAKGADVSNADGTTTAWAGLEIEAGTTKVQDLKDKTITLDNGDTVKLSDLFDITVKNGSSTVADSAAITGTSTITFTAKQTGKLSDTVMNAITYTTGASTEVTPGWDEGETGAGKNTHYEITIDTTKLAGGQAFSFGTDSTKTKTFEFDFNDEETDNGTVTDPAAGTEVGGSRTPIDLSSSMTVSQQADAIKAAVAGNMTDFNVKVEVTGNTIKLTMDAKQATEATNLGGVRFSSASGTFGGAVYNAFNSYDKGNEGTYAEVTYDFDITQLKSGDSLTIGGTTIKVGDKTATEKDDNGNLVSITLSEADAQNAEKLKMAFESAGYQQGRIDINTTDNKLTITDAHATGGKAEDLAKGNGKVSLTSTRTLTTGGLTLQIGDTADSFNQMSVSIGDMHTNAMGTKNGDSIADIDISSQEGAAAAVDVIKNAINYVSSVRGDLGATQNRLEHTANNLSVMAENIQDAESTIRDTDVAEEMMSYVKNNILVQSAQAMLAQANQLPQGVLQLLG